MGLRPPLAWIAEAEAEYRRRQALAAAAEVKTGMVVLPALVVPTRPDDAEGDAAEAAGETMPTPGERLAAAVRRAQEEGLR